MQKFYYCQPVSVTLKQFGFAQHIKDPTRYSINKNSCLDLICSNSDNIADAIVCDVNISDHELVFLTRKHFKTKIKKHLLLDVLTKIMTKTGLPINFRISTGTNGTSFMIQ